MSVSIKVELDVDENSFISNCSFSIHELVFVCKRKKIIIS